MVVDYDAGHALVDCLESLRREGVHDVVVVENGDLAAALSLVRSAGLKVPILGEGCNLGYGAGANRGASALGGDDGDQGYLLVCNADVRLHQGAIASLAGALDDDAALAVVGPRILTPKGEVYPSARRFPSMGDAVGHAMLGLVYPNNPFSRRYRGGEVAREPRDPGLESSGPLRQDRAGASDGPDPGAAGRALTAGNAIRPQGGAARPVDWVSGACFMVRRQSFEELGGFDEAYFMYAEDLDLCWRARRAGWGVALVPAATVTHVQGVSTERHPYRMLVEHHRSAWRFARRCTAGWRRMLLPAAGAVLGVRLVANVGIRLLRGSAPR